MNQPLDPFAQSFDAIEVGQSDVRRAFEQAIALSAPSAAAPDFAAPGFYLVDDAGGRFVVDRDMGMVSLRDAALLVREAGAVHQVRLKVVQASGNGYELNMTLRVTGHVPQMVGAEEFAFGQAAPLFETAPTVSPRRSIAWEAFSTTANAAPAPLGAEGAAFGALLSVQTPQVTLSGADLSIGNVPNASPKHAHWSI